MYVYIYIDNTHTHTHTSALALSKGFGFVGWVCWGFGFAWVRAPFVQGEVQGLSFGGSFCKALRCCGVRFSVVLVSPSLALSRPSSFSGVANLRKAQFRAIRVGGVVWWFNSDSCYLSGSVSPIVVVQAPM